MSMPRMPLPTMPSGRDWTGLLRPASGALLGAAAVRAGASPLIAPRYAVPLIVAGAAVMAPFALWTTIRLAGLARLAWRAHRFHSGHPSAAESRELEWRTGLAASQDQARAVARGLVMGGAFDLGRPWDVAIDTNEQVLADCPSDYARYYSEEARPLQPGTRVIGGPGGTSAGLDAAPTAQRRRPWTRGPQGYRWRENQSVRALVTQRRVLVQRNDLHWLSFHYDAIVAIRPQLPAGVLILEFESASPLRLAGPASAVTAVAAVYALFGAQGLRDHPGLEPLRIRDYGRAEPPAESSAASPAEAPEAASPA
ncbi:hypothetical protein [Actinomyces marmotae]|uniref:Uncharacterized protein n=1 Tax=Actinomyces marmotae TaxID=2737173 RepID=A0A6M8AYH5_9ACTO|nr:hypothetical protein [Actinomyces marmotae]QKD79549.1 hypothetical protein HPC72_04165 [Actinomyces marmotae]